jgi:hypothetical protein
MGRQSVSSMESSFLAARPIGGEMSEPDRPPGASSVGPAQAQCSNRLRSGRHGRCRRRHVAWGAWQAESTRVLAVCTAAGLVARPRAFGSPVATAARAGYEWS